MTVLQSIIKLRRMKKAGYLYRGFKNWKIGYKYNNFKTPWGCIQSTICIEPKMCFQVPIEYNGYFGCSYKEDFTKG